MNRSKVAAVITNSKSVLADVDRLMDMAGISEAFDPQSKTILKDNISWHLFFPSANTTPWQLEGAIRSLRNHNYEDIVAVHNQTVVTNSEKGERLNRLNPVYEMYDIPQIANFKPDEILWESYTPKGKTPALHHIYPDGIFIPREFHGTNILHLPTIKCHIYTTTTGAMKNAFGGLLNTKRHYSHSVIHRTLVDLLIVQQEIHSGLFALMDGTHAGDGPGPRTMRPVEMNIMLASADQVAIDAVAARLMGFNPLSIDYIKIAHEEGLGVGDPKEIELVGDDVTDKTWKFTVGDNLASIGGDLFWFSPLKKIQKLLFHTPLVNLFILASFVYHDFIWYPLRSGPAIRKFNTSQWGKLFEERYGSEGSIYREMKEPT